LAGHGDWGSVDNWCIWDSCEVMGEEIGFIGFCSFGDAGVIGCFQEILIYEAYGDGLIFLNALIGEFVGFVYTDEKSVMGNDSQMSDGEPVDSLSDNGSYDGHRSWVQTHDVADIFLHIKKLLINRK